MKIDRVSIESFKSLIDVTLNVGKFTVITGPNGAGKSNLVDAINFLGEVYSVGLDQAVVRNGGLLNMVHAYGYEYDPVKFSVRAKLEASDLAEFQQNSPQGPWSSSQVAKFGLTFEHTFTLRIDDKYVGEFDILSDQLEFRDVDERTLVALGYDDLSSSAPTRDEVVYQQYASRLSGSRMLRELLGPLAQSSFSEYAPSRRNLSHELLIESLNVGQALPFFKRGIAGIRLFQLSPFQCRRPSVATPNAMLDRYGENLPAAAFHLQKFDPEAWSNVESAMESIFPEIDVINFTPTQDRKLAVEFLEVDVQRAWTSSEVSDGTIQTFALLVALYDKRSPVLMVEEPENSVHPWILRQFINLCRAKEDKQIVLTTHSPVVLNYVPPWSVYLMSSERGRSVLHRLVDDAGDSRALLDDGEIALFDLYDSGVIPTAVPRGLSNGGDDDAS